MVTLEIFSGYHSEFGRIPLADTVRRKNCPELGHRHHNLHPPVRNQHQTANNRFHTPFDW